MGGDSRRDCERSAGRRVGEGIKCEWQAVNSVFIRGISRYSHAERQNGGVDRLPSLPPFIQRGSTAPTR